VVSLTRWVQGINVNTKIHRILRSHPLPDLLDDSCGTNSVDLAGFGYLKPTVPVILVIAWP
jgi:hypothetical protein